MTRSMRHGVPSTQYHSSDSILALYHEISEEIARLRNTEWRIGYYFLTLGVGLIVMLLDESFQRLLDLWLRVALTMIQVLSGVFAIYYLYKTHVYLTQQRSIRRKIERMLGFCDPGIYAFDSVLPEGWKQPVKYTFQLRNLVLPIAFIVVVVQVFSVFILWTVGQDLAAIAVPAP